MNASAMRIEWDSTCKKEIEEAKTLYRQAKLAGREVVDLEGRAIESFRSYFKGMIIKEIALLPTEFAMRIFDETGDRRLIWNATDPAQVKDAATLFDEYVKKGWKAYAIRDDGSRGRRIREFDAVKQELVVDDESTNDKLKAFSDKVKAEVKDAPPPKTMRQGLNDFVKSFKQIKMLPRTYPG